MIVSDEIAYLLKEKGFDFKCKYYKWDKEYYAGSNSILHLVVDEYNHNSLKSRVSCPTYDDVLQWMREKFFIHIYLRYSCSANEILDFYYVIDFMINKFRYSDYYVHSMDRSEQETLDDTIKTAFKYLE